MDLLPPLSQMSYFRGNLHGHSVHSDGVLEPDEVVKIYKSLGYDFTCLSDHLWSDSKFSATSVLDTRCLNEDNFITIPSAEIHCRGKKYDNDGLWHIVANGLPLDFLCANDDETATQLVHRAKESGAFVTIAHPEWYSLTSDEALSVAHAHSVEIYNHSCHIEAARGYGTTIVDFLLQENYPVLLTATDDSHFRMNDAGGGWVMVASNNLDEISLLQALKAGQYYSSTGLEIFEFVKENHLVSIKCSPASHICLSGAGNKSLSSNGMNLTFAQFDLSSFPSDWFRITIVDSCGRMAWSNPVSIS
ncbi:MAG: phosphotransferase [Proteobacteria bacterium]|nr:phosphotransferase [Pseudomonadota bacterium]